MSQLNQEKEINADNVDLAHRIDVDDGVVVVDYLVGKLQEAMGNPHLQGEVQSKLQHLCDSQIFQEDKAPMRSPQETSTKGTYKGHEGRSREDPTRRQEDAMRQELSKERNGSETPITSDSDVAPRRWREKRSQSPPKRKRPSHTSTPRRKRRRTHHLLLLLLALCHHHLPMMRVAMFHQIHQRKEGTKEAMRHGRGHTSLKSSRREGRISLSLPTMELLEQLTKCWLSSNNLMQRLEMSTFWNLQSCAMSPCTSKNQPINGGKVFMPQDKL